MICLAVSGISAEDLITKKSELLPVTLPKPKSKLAPESHGTGNRSFSLPFRGLLAIFSGAFFFVSGTVAIIFICLPKSIKTKNIVSQEVQRPNFAHW